MALNIEIVVDCRMYAEKALSEPCRFEPLHLALSSPHYLMRLLCPIVASKTLFMRAGQSQMPKCRAVGAELVLSGLLIAIRKARSGGVNHHR